MSVREMISQSGTFLVEDGQVEADILELISNRNQPHDGVFSQLML